MLTLITEWYAYKYTPLANLLGTPRNNYLTAYSLENIMQLSTDTEYSHQTPPPPTPCV